jgi:toxoflavin biosynthesis protein ToxD
MTASTVPVAKVDPGDGHNPHDVTDREAMGLPQHLRTRVDDRLGDRHPDLVGASVPALVAHAEDPGAPWERRYLAGTLLAVLGDPRIRPYDPLLVDVPAGRPWIGLAWEDVDEVLATWRHRGVEREWIEKECPRHPVAVPAFRIMRYPVSNLEYRLFMEDTGRWPAPTSWSLGTYPLERANHPVWTVEDTEADAYATWLSRRTGRRFRLPTEEQWEYAASGGTERTYPWGEELDPDVVNTAEHGPWTTTPVGIHPGGRSPFGVDDLGGNVEEYLRDCYRPYSGGADVVDDLLEELDEPLRVARGGSFSRFGDLARCRRRHGRYPRPYYAVGFRLVEEVDDQERPAVAPDGEEAS